MKEILWSIIGYDHSILDNRIVYHICGAYAVTHIASLFFKRYYWTICIFVAILKELVDHFVFGCSNNEIKHTIDIVSWVAGGLSYHIIVLLKRRKYGYTP